MPRKIVVLVAIAVLFLLTAAPSAADGPVVKILPVATTAEFEGSNDIAYLPWANKFASVWDGNDVVKAKVYALGETNASAFALAEIVDNVYRLPAVACDEVTRRCLATWLEGKKMVGQFFNESGKIGGNFDLAITPYGGTFSAIPVLAAGDGEFLLFWSDYYDVFYRRFNGSGWEPRVSVAVDPGLKKCCAHAIYYQGAFWFSWGEYEPSTTITRAPDQFQGFPEQRGTSKGVAGLVTRYQNWLGQLKDGKLRTFPFPAHTGFLDIRYLAGASNQIYAVFRQGNFWSAAEEMWLYRFDTTTELFDSGTFVAMASSGYAPSMSSDGNRVMIAWDKVGGVSGAGLEAAFADGKSVGVPFSLTTDPSSTSPYHAVYGNNNFVAQFSRFGSSWDVYVAAVENPNLTKIFLPLIMR